MKTFRHFLKPQNCVERNYIASMRVLLLFLHFVLTYLSAPRDILPGAAAALPDLSLSTLSGEVRELARLAPLAPL